MNHRVPITCDTCQQGIILRIGIGSQITQNIAIQCPNCKQKISFELQIDKETKKVSDAVKIENFNFVDKEEDNFIAINLHTELIYPKEYINEKMMMPAMSVSMRLQEHAISKGLFDTKKSFKHSKNNGFLFQSIFHGLGGDSELLEDWLIIKKSYSLYTNHQLELMKNELNKYSQIKNIYMHNSSILHSVIFNFLHRFISPNLSLYNQIKQNFSKAKKQKQNFKDFKLYYDNELQDIHWKNYINIFDEYFKNFSEFNRLLLNSKIELHPEEGTESVFCPTNFNDVGMFYGNSYEYITTHLTIFACINNINSGRIYDTFKHLTLKKYTELNKDSRFQTFQDEISFKLFTDNINSSLRNASHHKWFYIDDKNPGYLLYRSGGTGAIRKISYMDYIYQSNLLMIKLAIMAMLEVKFLFKDKSR